MRWPVFAMFAFGALVVQLSVRSVLTLNSAGGISPDLVACLLVFVALFAHRTSVMWACWMMGLLIDLAPPEQDLSYRIIGQHALGYVFGGYVILTLRTMVFRQRALTLGFLTFVMLLAASIVGVAMLALRSQLYNDALLPGGALRELWQRILIALYSGVIGMPVGWALLNSLSLWGFQTGSQRRH
jgi:rod shape-determining protein MreD